MTTDPLQSPEKSMDLPAPVPPQEVAGVELKPTKQLGTEVNPEFLPAIGSTPQPVATAQTQTATPVLPAAVPAPMPVTPPAQHTAPTNGNPELAEDVDLIEKEWVDKAKAIVNHTKDDPHRQNKEINKMKADYIKKRYNKDIQVSE